ncbi:MAG: tRNA-binding protein, partial [Candidatus Njordarchaeales archaeon]
RAKNLLITRVTDGTRNYEVVTNDLTVRSGDVLLFAVLPPRDFFGIVSQGMFLGGEKIRRGTENVVGNTTSLSENEKRNLKSIIIQFLKE